MEWYQWVSFIGIPSMFSVLVWFYKIIRKQNDQYTALKLGLQAMLRGQMINDFNHWSEKGYAPIYARENFENLWQQYHSLGANGVMDDIRKKFQELPTAPKNS
ncbi:MAG: hypothetical protein II388_08590 [Clostridia bacterium]|nr:hypothetical protein [Clostridia bacterium]